MTDKKISTESYKGVRDFYPEDMFVQTYIFRHWREVVESFGYVEYNASLLEPAELYRAKSGEEIVNEQTYTFTDRGGREVTLRPEMTPTVARMIAGRHNDLAFPLRWYSIPNVFRYEKPQRGRLREHWQLNVDLFGAEGIQADCEIISVAYAIMKKFGAKDEDFVIKLNSRKILNDLYSHFSLSENESHAVSKIIDRKDKITPEVFEKSLEEVVGEKTKDIVEVLSSPEKLLKTLGTNKNADDLLALIEKLKKSGIQNVVFDPTLNRGFDYYTATVFEVFDTSPENNRSVFGGGRYDDILDVFGAKKIPVIGFGAGDVTAQDFLETHNLLPTYVSSTELFIGTLSPEYIERAEKLAEKLRAKGLRVSVNLLDKKIGDQIKTAHKQHIPYVLAIGENEVKNNTYSLKNMETGVETLLDADGIVNLIQTKK